MSKLCQGFFWKSKVQKNRVKSGNQHALWRKQNLLSCAFLYMSVLCLGFCSFSCMQKRSVASLWGSCQVFVINHIFEYFYAQSSLQSFESKYLNFCVSFRNIFNYMKVHHGDKTAGENRLVYDLYDLGCPNTLRDFLLWGHFQLMPLPHCPSDKTFVLDNLTI